MRNAIDVVFDILLNSREGGIHYLTFLLFDTKNYHDGMSVSINDMQNIYLPIEPIGTLKERMRNLEKDYEELEIALSSEVVAGGGALYIPMVDLHGRNQELLEKKLGEIGKNYSEFVPGALLCSGKSYHYYGSKLLNGYDWGRFLGACLLCQAKENGTKVNLADVRWVGHTLTRGGVGLLRIFKRHGGRESFRPEPYLVADID